MATTADSADEIKLLLRSIKPEIFRLVIVQHNHRQAIDQVEEQIRHKYADRPLHNIRTEGKSYRALMDTIYRWNSGVLMIEDFQKILDKPEVYVAFNQRRDKIAQYPLALICFMPLGNEILQECMKKLPDFWSFRNLVIALESEAVTLTALEPEPAMSTLGGRTLQEKERELNRLTNRIDELSTDPANIAAIVSYYPQILQLLEETGAYRRGLEYAEHFLQIAKKNHSAQKPLDIYPDALDWKAKFCKYLGHFEEAKQLFEEALALDTSVYGETHPRVAARQSGLATIYEELGDYQRAKDLLEKALTSDLNSYGAEDPNVAAIQSNLAAVYQRLGDYTKAQALLEKALEIGIKSYGSKHHIIVAARQSNLATVYRALGEYAKAEKLLKKALVSAEASYEVGHPKIATRQSNLALVYLDVGEYEKARDLLEKALPSVVASYGTQHVSVATTKSNLAVAYQDLREYDKAKKLYQDAYSIFCNTLGEDHPQTKVVKAHLKRIKGK